MALDLDRLCQSIRRSRKSLEFFRDQRREMVRQYVGQHWSEEGSPLPVPANLISLYVSVMARNLVAKTPRVLLSTFDRSVQSTVKLMELWLNQEAKRMRLGNALQRVVLDALFSIGVAKVALASPDEAAASGWGLRAGQPFVRAVDLDDFAFDPHARDFAEAGWVAHRRRVPLDAVKDSKIYSKTRKDLVPSDDPPHNREGDERIGMLGRGYQGLQDEWEDMVELWEVYLPRERLVVTLAEDHVAGAMTLGKGGKAEALRVQRWIGPEAGPYHVLGFGTVPGSAMPKGPVQDLIDLHLCVNALYRKLMDQAERQKEVLPVPGSASADGETLVKTHDGEAFRCERADMLKPVSFGGPHQLNVLMAEKLGMMFKSLGGNLDLLGGLAPQSNTAKQDTLLNENASAGVADMQDRTVDVASSVASALCWYYWHDPVSVQRVSVPLPPDRSFPDEITPERRQKGRFEDLDLRVDPYSLRHATPQSKLATLDRMVQGVILPLAPLLQQQGIQFDIDAYLQKYAAYTDTPDVHDLVNVREPPPPMETAGTRPDEPTVSPPPGERRYVRESVNMRTDRGDALNMMNAMAGVDPGGSPNGSAA